MRHRDLRRHHEQRIKQRVCAELGRRRELDPRTVGRTARARRQCSCALCGNPRRYFGEPTIQERRAAVADPPDARPW